MLLCTRHCVHARSLVRADSRYPVVLIWPLFGFRLGSVVLICAILGFGGALHVLPASCNIYIKYTVSTYITIKKLTFIEWIINLDKIY